MLEVFFDRNFIFNFAQNVSFHNEPSGSPNGGIISYLWDFGDGETGSGNRVAHFYKPGSYLAKLTVTDFAGLTSTQTQHINVSGVGDNIVASISCSRDHARSNCYLIALDQLNQINHLKINWGDDTEDFPFSYSLGQGVYVGTHEFANGGTYNIIFTVGTERGENKMAQTRFSTNVLVADIKCSTNNLMVFCGAGGSYDPTLSTLSYKFEYGDGYIEENNSGWSNHAYAQAGLSTIILTIKNALGDQASTTTQVMTLQGPSTLPLAGFNCDSLSPLTLYCWDDGTYDSNGLIVSKKLSFDDNTTDFLVAPNITRHQFTTAGMHTITLTVTDSDGGVAKVTKMFTVKENHPPVASFVCNTPEPQRIGCYSTSSDPDSGDLVATFDWELGDGNTQSGLMGYFNYKYAASSTYTIKLTVHDQFGGSSFAEKNIITTSYGPPTFEIEADLTSGAPPLLVNFKAKNVQALGGTSASYKWIFGDGNESNEADVTHTFSNSGLYEVRLQVTDSIGGMTEKKIQISVGNRSNLVINADFLSGVAPLTVSFDASESTNTDTSIVKFEWFYIGRKIGEGATVSYIFDTVGSNAIQLVATDNYGIKTSLTKSIDVTAPDLYIEGSFPEKAYVGRKYVASFSGKFSTTIIGENISYELINAPVGVSLDLQKTQITWIPSLQDKGEVEFSLEVTDGQITFQKVIHLSVLELEKMASTSSNGTDGTITIDLGNNLGNAHIYYPVNETPYTLDVYKVKDVAWGELFAETSIPIKKPLHINFEKQLGVTQTISKASLLETISPESTYPTPFKINMRLGNILFCAEKLINLQFRNNLSVDLFEKVILSEPLNNGNVIYTKFNVGQFEPNFQKVYKVIQDMNLEISHANIYFLSDFKNTENPTATGMVPNSSPDSLYLNLAKLSLLNEAQIKYIIYHESFHIIQNLIIGCLDDIIQLQEKGGFGNLQEGSADYYALSKLNNLEKKEALRLEYGTVRYKSNPYLIGADVFDDGLFSSLPNSAYRSRLFWEFSPINMYVFFDNFGKEYRTPPVSLKSNADVIRILKFSTNSDYVSKLGASTLGDGIANLSHYLNNSYRLDFTIPNFPGNPILPILSYLYDYDQYSWATSTSNSNQNKGCNNSEQVIDTVKCDEKIIDISGARKGYPKSFTLNIPSMSGRSVKFSGLNNSAIPSLPGSVDDKEFSSQMNAMLKISYTNPEGNISSKVISIVETNNGSMNPLRQFNLSLKTPNSGEEVLIGTRGFRYNGLLRPINQPTWSGFNALGLEFYKASGLAPQVQGTNFTDFLWEDGVPVAENIMMDFANTSDKMQNVVVTIEPLCERKSVTSQNNQLLNLNFICEGACLDQKTINICWRGYIYDGSHNGDHCMFGNTPPMNTYDNLMRYKDTIYPLTNTTEFYVCGEDKNEVRLIDVIVSP